MVLLEKMLIEYQIRNQSQLKDALALALGKAAIEQIRSEIKWENCIELLEKITIYRTDKRIKQTLSNLAIAGLERIT